MYDNQKSFGSGEERQLPQPPHDNQIERAKLPLVKRISKHPVAVVSVAIITVIFLALLGIDEGGYNKHQGEKSSDATPSAGEQINNLPSTYQEIPPAKKLGAPNHSEIGELQAKADGLHEINPNDALEQARAAAEAVRLREENEASRSKIKFSVGDMQITPQDKQGQEADLIKSLTAPRKGELAAGGETKQVDPSRDTDNRQDDKSEFANKKRSTDPYLQQSLVKPHNHNFVSAGSIIPGVMVSGINSDLPGTIVGQVSQNVYDTPTGRSLLIPQGTKMVGLYSSVITYGQERVQVIWTRILFPNGTSISLEGMPGVDLSGYSGLSDRVNNHYWKLLGGVVLSSIVGATAQVAQGSTSQLNPTFEQMAAQGAAQSINDVGQKITQKNLNIQPTLEIRQGMRFNIMVQHDIELPTYAN